MSRGLPNAHDTAGIGPNGTWPRTRPLLHIDQAFVGNNWRATRYDTFDPGIGRHRAQIVSISPR